MVPEQGPCFLSAKMVFPGSPQLAHDGSGMQSLWSRPLDLNSSLCTNSSCFWALLYLIPYL